MKCVFVVVSCLLAAASAGYLGGANVYGYNGAYNGDYNGDYNGAYSGASHAVAYNAPLVHGGYGAYGGYGYAAPAAHAYAHGGYYGADAPLVDPVAIAAGAPLPVGDTYEVAAAKAAHFQAHAAARGRLHGNGYGYAAAPLAHGYAAAPLAHGYGGHYGGEARLVDPVAIAAGAPLPTGDTYEVAAAKAAHLQAHAAAKHGHLGLY